MATRLMILWTMTTWKFTCRAKSGTNSVIALPIGSVASEVEMRPWVLGWGAQVEVLAPPSLRAHVAGSMADGARLYADD